MSKRERYIKDYWEFHYPKYNPETFKIGDIVYYIGNISKDSNKKTVKFGMVMANYMGEIALQLFDWVNTETVNGIPIKEFKNTEWKQIPKGKHGSDFKPVLGYDDSKIKEYTKKYGNNFNIKDKDNILNLIENGILVRVDDKEYKFPELEYEKDKYRLLLKFYPHDYRPRSINVRYDKIYMTFDEAQVEIDKHNKHEEYLRSLSDYDYSVYEINETLDRWKGLYRIPNDTYNKIKNKIMDLDNIEDVVVRLSSGHIEWKYERNRKWISMEE